MADINRVKVALAETASLIARQAEQYVVYVDTCLFSKEELSQCHIVFKKIPRDIKRF